ncbi:MAG: cell division protein FtsK [Candidatus Epulonipiscioides saccharophilum]|nr:MAG: cell division protein FtsK [Epulopiscium sp. AS2M-Bin001]
MKKKKRKKKINQATEIIGITIIGCCILMIASIFSEQTGMLGSLIKKITVGLFGIGGYALPFYILYLGVSYIKSGKLDIVSNVKKALPIFIILVLGSQVFQEDVPDRVANYLSIYLSDISFINGGLVGRCIINILLKFFGLYGTYILLTSVILLYGFKLYNFSFTAWMRSLSGNSPKKYKSRSVKKATYSNRTASSKKATYSNRTASSKKATYSNKTARSKNTSQKSNTDKKPIRYNYVTKSSTQSKNKATQASAKASPKSATNQRLKVSPNSTDSMNLKSGQASSNSSQSSKVRSNQNNNSSQRASYNRDNNSYHQESNYNLRKTIQEPLSVYDKPVIHVMEQSQNVARKRKVRRPVNSYKFPNIDILTVQQDKDFSQDTKHLQNMASKLENTLKCFGIEAKVIEVHKGPSVTRYEIAPKQGTKVSKILNLSDDIALSLAAKCIRIEAPIPGKSLVGIEIPNEQAEMVLLRDILDTDKFDDFPSKLAFGVGKDISGAPVIFDIARMPHVLIAGATGSGKSVCINTLIASILYKASPRDVKLLMVDPKVVELNIYNGIPHLIRPVVTDPKEAASALNSIVKEMADRYQLFAENMVRDIKGYNKKVDKFNKMPHIVVIIDELSDLMMTAAKEVEDSICRLAQMARASGIHLVIATQRPSVDVITGVIKANIPSRMAFAVSSGVDSRTILDTVGAEKLLGKGDMLFYPMGEAKPIRVQGAFISDQEVETLVETIKNPTYAKLA